MSPSPTPVRLGIIGAVIFGSVAWTTAFQFVAIVVVPSRVLSDPVWLLTGFSFLFAIGVVGAGIGGMTAVWLARSLAIAPRPRRSHSGHVAAHRG